jgi:glutamate--cysteine ligase
MHDTQFSDIPHLANALGEPFLHFIEVLTTQADAIEAWFSEQFILTKPPFYASTDLRHAGFKLAPVDTNLFPGGFNNLGESVYPEARLAIQQAIADLAPKTRRILLLCESQSRNPLYFENCKSLQSLLESAELEVRVGVIHDGITQPRTITTPSGKNILIEPVSVVEKQLVLAQFEPDLILLNSDLSEGIPNILLECSQLILPSPQLGWAKRLKSSHFQHLTSVATEFANRFNFDPWTVSPLFQYCGEINFMTGEGEDCLVRHAESVFAEVTRKYQEYNIPHEPFLVVKADAGTYGMAVMSIKSPDELRQLNRKQRQSMSLSKGGRAVTRAIIQEGVHTFETWGEKQSSAEPVLYMIGSRVIGCFYRVHDEKGIDQNLNAPGMKFAAYDCKEHPDPENVRCYSYSVVARLALLSAAREMKEILDAS